jgi:sugar lactone lactonase YvrE
VVDVPVSQVSSCAFGGPSLDELYITTSREGPGEREPQAGALFMSRPGVRGVPVHEYTSKRQSTPLPMARRPST